MSIPSPVLNNSIKRNYLVIDGRLTKEGINYLKLMNIYWKVNKIKSTI
jgi:hypothetical protein